MAELNVMDRNVQDIDSEIAELEALYKTSKDHDVDYRGSCPIEAPRLGFLACLAWLATPLIQSTRGKAVRPDTHAERWAAWLEANDHRQTSHICGYGTGEMSTVCATGAAIEMEGGDPNADDCLRQVLEMGRREGYSRRFLKRIVRANDNGADFNKLARRIRKHG